MVLIPVIFIHSINIIGIDTNGIGTSQWLNKYKQFVTNYVRFKKWTIKVDILSIDTSGISLIWFNLVWFYGMSTTVGYLMPNSFLYIKTVLFQIIQLNISTVLCLHTVKCQNSSISNNLVQHKYTI